MHLSKTGWISQLPITGWSPATAGVLLRSFSG